MKTKEQAKANLEASISYIPDRYKQGVATADWLTKASSDNAERNYADGVAKAVAAKRRQNNVKKVSNSDWQNAASVKGGAVIGQRIRDSLDKQSANFGVVYDRVVSDIAKLPPRTTDFRANITNRVIPVAESWKKNSGKL